MEPEKLQHIFACLNPIRRSNSTGERAGHRTPFFAIQIIEGEPFLKVLKNPKGKGSASAADLRLHSELERLYELERMFGDFDFSDSTIRLSLWTFPHLVFLFEEDIEIMGPDNNFIEFSRDPASLILKITTNEELSEYPVSLSLNTGEEELSDITILGETVVLSGNRVFRVRSLGDNFSQLSKMLTPVDRDSLEIYLTLILNYFTNLAPELNGIPAKKSSHTEHSIPTLFLEKVATDKALYLRTGSQPGSLSDVFPSGMSPTVTVSIDSHDQITIREIEGCDLKERTDRLEDLIRSCAPNRIAKKEVYRDGNFFIVPEETAGPFLLKNLPKVLEDFRLVGSEKLREYKVVAPVPKLNFRFSSGIDYLEGDGEVSVGGDVFSIGDILKQYASKRYVELSDGNRAILDEGYIERLRRLFRRRNKEGRIRVTLFDLPEVEDLIKSKITGTFAARSRKVLEGFNKLKTSKPPKYEVKAKLRPYQKEGVKWLDYLYRNELGGCLADDMGLGKTLQTISLLTTIYPGAQNPTLIVMPRSLLFNWEKELDRFAPTLSHSTYYGTDRNLEKALKSQIILTTYAIVRKDIEKLKDLKFEFVILDESQNIKNVIAQSTAAVYMLKADHRLALSGTPMENNLTELYSLFRFLNPTMFGTIDDFNASYTYPIQRNGDKNASESLRRKIFPFILRRLKKDVLKDLPDRIDQTIYVEMNSKQKKIYDERRESYRREISETIAREGIQKSQFVMFQALNELRRIASVPESLTNGVVTSPKIEELLESLMTSIDNGHKSVVFFNFLAGLELVSVRLEKLGIQFETMTGSTSASMRKKIVERFQADPDCKVMLMTLKVGGVGLNLTAADTVYIFEPWWNKAAEEQAINRLHRIGQKNTVTSYSAITLGTIEEKILQLQEIKSELFNELISADSTSTKSLSQQDIEFILS